MSAVEVRSLAKRYSSVIAVSDVSFAAEAGAITAVLGPNGAGKTTTVEICCGLRRADTGSVSVLGLDSHRDARTLKTRVGVMPQAGGSSASGVYPSARVGEVLALHAAFYAHPLPLDGLLTRLGLDKVRRTPWRRLSGGEQQRLSLALSVVGRPEVVFLDEPTAGLDVQGRHATWDLIHELRAAGSAVILTTHGLDEAEELADHVVIVDSGFVVASGSPAELTQTDGGALQFDAPAGLPLTELALALSPGLQAAEPAPGHYVVTGAVTPAVVAAVTAWCSDRGVMADRLSTGGRSLEDVFLELTGKELRP